MFELRATAEERKALTMSMIVLVLAAALLVAALLRGLPALLDNLLNDGPGALVRPASHEHRQARRNRAGTRRGRWTCAGEARGGCGHQHLSYAAAKRCCERDRALRRPYPHDEGAPGGPDAAPPRCSCRPPVRLRCYLGTWLCVCGGLTRHYGDSDRRPRAVSRRTP